MTRSRGFTLIELLVVVGILALLIAILIPAMARARERGYATRCLANLKGIATGMSVYSDWNGNLIIPSYNMTGSGGAGAITLDGWPAILDRDGFVPGYAGITNNAFFCPDTNLIAGAANGASTAGVPTGYQDWPVTMTAGTDTGTEVDPPLPTAGFGDANGLYIHEIRSSYWINANNPLGGVKAPSANPYYTTSVGYTYSDGSTAKATNAASIVRPAALVILADGIYAGQQKNTHLGDTSSRIGYRHLGQATTNTVANAAFADGHAEPIESNNFPRSTDVSPGDYSVQIAK